VSRFYALATACWAMILGRAVLRALLALNGSLEWRGWYWNPGDWYPSYVTMWEIIMIPMAMWWIWFCWKQIEWKRDG
jgi:hypothetical protein